MAPAGLATIGAATLALLAVALGWHPVGDYFTESDFYEYAVGGARIAAGQVDVARYAIIGPLYEFLLAIPARLGWPAFTFGCLVSVVAAAATLLLWRATLRARLGEPAAFAAVTLMAANAVFFRYGYSATTDLPALALQAAAVHALLAGRGRWPAARAGAFAALAFLTRYNSFALVPAALVHFAWPGEAPLPARRAAALRYLVAFAVIALPWTVYSRAHGHWPGEGLFRNAAFYAQSGSSRNVQDRPVGPDPPVAQAPAPPGVMTRVLANAPAHLREDAIHLLGWPVSALALLGALALFGSRRRAGAWGRIGLQGAAMFAGLAPIFYSDRYSLAVLPTYLSLAGVGLAAPRLAPRVGGRVLPLALALAAWPLWDSLRANVELQRQVRTQLPVEVLDSARALASERPSDGAVLARKGAVAFYASRPAAFFPRVGSLAALAAGARDAHASHLYFSWYEGMLRPEFWYLLDTTAVVPGLTRIHATDPHPSVLYRIGAEFGRDPEWLADSIQLGVHIARAETRALTESQAWDAHVVLGHQARREARYVEALEHYLAATRGAPDNSAVWLYAGDMQLALGAFDAARASYERAMQIEPRSLGARLGIGWTQYRAGAWKLAAATWRPTIALAPDEATLRAMRETFLRTGATAAVAEVDAALAKPSNSTPKL